MTRKFITINKQTIAQNIRREAPEPPIRVATAPSGKGRYAHGVAIKDETGRVVAELVYSAHCPIMGCGARVVLMTDLEVELRDEVEHGE